MIDQPEIVHTEAQPAAVIHVTVEKHKIREVMGPGLQELRETASSLWEVYLEEKPTRTELTMPLVKQ